MSETATATTTATATNSLMKMNREDDKTKNFWNGLHHEKNKKENIEARIGNNCSVLSVDKRLLFTAIAITLFTV